MVRQTTAFALSNGGKRSYLSSQGLLRFRRFRGTLGVAVLIVVTLTYYLFLSGDGGSYSHADTSGFSLHHNKPLAKPHKIHNWNNILHLGNENYPPVPVTLDFDQDGKLKGWDTIHQRLSAAGLSSKEKRQLKKIAEKHPIEVLIEHGEKRFEGLLARQSKTLPRAVLEYRRRYGRQPPKGFELWWHFCKEHQVKIVDDYDQIIRDIEPYFALSPETFRTRAENLLTTDHTYFINLDPNGPSSIDGKRAEAVRAKQIFSLLEPLAPLLPANLTIHFSDHDLGSWLLADDQRQLIKEAIVEGRYLSEDELAPYEKRLNRVAVKGIASACPPDSAAWERSIKKQRNDEVSDVFDEISNAETTFLHDPAATYNFCDNPALQTLHGGLAWDAPRETKLRPIFQLSKNSLNPEFLVTPLEAYDNATSISAQKKFVPWDEKTIDKLFWRGTSTGDSYYKREGYDWRHVHRTRLALMTAADGGSKDIWVNRGREWEKESWGLVKLNNVYLDVGLTGKPHQCREEDGTCAEMANELTFKERVSPEQSARYKYVLDVDGNGWSSRFHRLLLSGSVVLKATIYPEWFSDWMTPWVHYVPVQMDYADLYSIMSFFVGPPDGRQGGRDDLAKKIAQNGREFAEQYWRWEDMQAYMLRLLLEYARLAADDREAASYSKTYE